MPRKLDVGSPLRKGFLDGLEENPFWKIEPDSAVKADKIENLCRYLDRQKVQELPAKFEIEARERIAAISRESHDCEAVKRQTHSLAGLAGSMGCVDLGHNSRAIYADAEAGKAPAAAADTIAQLSQILEEALPLLKATLAAFPD